MTIHYFAYGSNLATRRLFQRIPNARLDSVATLRAHRLCFRKNDKGRSGKCDIEFTGDSDDIVYGALYLISHEEKQTLDSYESHGFGYIDREIEVIRACGNALRALTYVAIDIDHTRQPFHWYKEHVLRGAREHRFPADYIAWIEQQASIDDPDAERARRELAIYRDRDDFARATPRPGAAG